MRQAVEGGADAPGVPTATPDGQIAIEEPNGAAGARQVTVERRLFQSATVWFVAGLLAGLWLLGIFTGGGHAGFAAVRNLHVALMVPGWSGMVGAAALLAAVRRRTGRLPSDGWGTTAMWLWNAWCAGTTVGFFLPPVPLVRTGLAVLLPVTVGCLGLAAIARPSGWAAAAAATGAVAFLTLHGLPPVLPGDAGFNALAVASGAVAALLLWRRAAFWAALLWLPAAVVHAPWAVALAVAVTAVLAAASVPAVLASPGVGSAFLAFGLAADAAVVLIPTPTPLAAAGGLSSAGFAALYLLAPRLVRTQVARLHATLHLPGFAALIAGLQVGWPALAWPGALATVAGAGYVMLSLAGPADPARPATHPADEGGST